MIPAWLGVAVAAIALLEASKLAGQEQAPAQTSAPAGTTGASPAEYDGWKVYHSFCDRCHGQDAMGSTFAPNLRESVGANGMTEAAFASVVGDGRADKGMPAFTSMITEAQIDQLFAYVKARSAGTLGPGRPKRAS